MVPAGHKANLETICRAADNGDLAIVEAAQQDSGEPAYLLAAVAFDGECFTITPLARLFDGNPYQQFLLEGAMDG